MIIDNESYFAKSQAVTAAAYGANPLDMVKAGLPFQPGMMVVAQVGPVASNPTTSMTIAIVTSATGAFAGEETVLQSKTILTAGLTADTRVMMEPLAFNGALQHINVKFTPNGGSATTGAYDVFLVIDNERSYEVS